MKHLLALLFMLLILLAAVDADAQVRERLLPSDQQPIRVTLGTTYERYVDEGNVLTELSTPFMAAFSVGSRVRVRLLSSLAVAGGDNLERMSGFNNARVAISYAQRVGNGSLAANLGVSLPTGKQELTAGAFETMRVLSRDVYSFRVPGLGQGLNISPSVTGAFPVSDDVVLGLGAAYQYRGSYTPRRGMTSSYKPGDEFLVTGGLDVRLARTTSLSGDVSYTLYGHDAVGGSQVYNAGNKLAATVQLLHTAGFDEVRLVARYRGRARSEVPLLTGAGGTADRQMLPSMVLVVGSYHMRLASAFSVTALAQARYFDETVNYAEQSVAELGGRMTFRLIDQVRLIPRFLYSFGSFYGFEAGASLDVRL